MREVTLHCEECNAGYTTVRVAGEGKADVVKGKCPEHLGRASAAPERPRAAKMEEIHRADQVAGEIEAALQALARLNPYPSGSEFVDAAIITGPVLSEVTGHLVAAQEMLRSPGMLGGPVITPTPPLERIAGALEAIQATLARWQALAHPTV